MDKPDRGKVLPAHRMASDGEPYIYEGTLYPVPKPRRDIDDMIDTYLTTRPQRQLIKTFNIKSSGDPTVSKETDNTPNANAPLETFREGAANIKLWQQQRHDGQIFVTASVGRSYKDRQSGQWKESKSFSPDDLIKLQSLIPYALAHARVHEHALNMNRISEEQETVTTPELPTQTQNNSGSPQLQATTQHVQQSQSVSQPQIVAQTAQQVLSQQEMLAQRSTMQATIQPAPQHTEPIQGYSQIHNHEPSD